MPFDGFKFNTRLSGKQKKYILNKLPYAITETLHGSTWQKVVINGFVEDGLYFQIKNKWLNIRGNLGKIANGNNYEDCLVEDCRYAFEAISEIFKISISSFKIDYIEIGVNIYEPPLHSLELSKSLLSYQNEPFVAMPKLSTTNSSYGFINELSNFTIKAYSKSLQEGLLKDCFRFEIRTKKMQFLQKKCPVRIYTPEDLLKDEVLLFVAQLIPKIYKSIFKAEPIVVTDLNQYQRELYYKFINPQSCKNIIKKIKNDNLSRSTFNKQKKAFQALFTYDVQDTVSAMIEDKMLKLTSFVWHNITYPTNEEEETISQNSQLVEDGAKYTILPFSLMVTLSTPQKMFQPSKPVQAERRFCLGCGKEITHQRNISKFCSEKYVGYKVAHSCRNKVSDTQRILNRKRKRFFAMGQSLFPEEDLFPSDVIHAKYFNHIKPP